MVNQALIDVVKNQLAGGVSEEDIREFLRRRGSDETEIRDIFDTIGPDAPTLREIPVVETPSIEEPAVPAQPADPEPVAPAPVTTEAHGIVREIPPLQPSTPFTPAVISPIMSASPVSSGVVLPPVSSRKRTFVIIGSISAAIVLLITGGLYVYSAYFASPDAVMDKMISNIRDVRSFAFAADLTTTTNDASSIISSGASNPFAGMFATQDGPTTITVKTSGAFDALGEGNSKLAVTLEATMDKWSMGDFVLGVEYRNIDRNNYLKVNNVPDLGFFSLSFLKNKWFVIEDKEAKDQLGASNASSETIIPTVTQEELDQLRDAWQDHRFLIVEEKLPSDEVDGVSTHHYKLSLDKDAFVSWVVKTDAIMQKEPVDQEKLRRDLDTTTIRAMEIWIGKWDLLPRKLLLQASFRDAVDQNKTSDVSITVLGSRFDAVQGITIPEGAQSFEEALQGVFAQMLGAGAPTATPATPQARNDQRKKDIAMIADAIKKNMGDNGGTFLCASGPLPQKATFLGAAGFGMSGYAIESCLVPRYLPALPKDPTKGGLGMSGYSTFYDQRTKKITVRAPYAEGGVKISITK